MDQVRINSLSEKKTVFLTKDQFSISVGNLKSKLTIIASRKESSENICVWNNMFNYSDLKIKNKTLAVFEDEEIYYYIFDNLHNNCVSLLKECDNLIMRINSEIIIGSRKKPLELSFILCPASQETIQQIIIEQLLSGGWEFKEIKENLSIYTESIFLTDKNLYSEITKLKDLIHEQSEVFDHHSDFKLVKDNLSYNEQAVQHIIDRINQHYDSFNVNIQNVMLKLEQANFLIKKIEFNNELLAKNYK
jgi:hypothetical protein